MQISIDNNTGAITVVTLDPQTNFPVRPYKILTLTDNTLTNAEKAKLQEAIDIIINKSHT